MTPTADIGAEGGKWWAVWTEQVGPGGEFAPQQLFQAKTFGTAADRRQITFTGSDIDNTEPSISLDGNDAVLAWTRRTAPQQPGRRTCGWPPTRTPPGPAGCSAPTARTTFVGQTVSAAGTGLDTMVTANGKGTLLIRSGLRVYSITSRTA